MKKYKELMITTIVCLIPMAIGAYFYDQLPAQVPVHWDSAGPVSYTHLDVYKRQPLGSGVDPETGIRRRRDLF